MGDAEVCLPSRMRVMRGCPRRFVSPGTSDRDSGPPDRRDDYHRERRRRSESSNRVLVKALAGYNDDKA